VRRVQRKREYVSCAASSNARGSSVVSIQPISQRANAGGGVLAFFVADKNVCPTGACASACERRGGVYTMVFENRIINEQMIQIGSAQGIAGTGVATIFRKICGILGFLEAWGGFLAFRQEMGFSR